MDVAVLDDRGILREVRTVSAADYKTDAAARTVALPPGHDMGQRLGQYFWDHNHQCFMPVSRGPLDDAVSESPGLVEALIGVADQLQEKGLITLSKAAQSALAEWRDRRR